MYDTSGTDGTGIGLLLDTRAPPLPTPDTLHDRGPYACRNTFPQAAPRRSDPALDLTTPPEARPEGAAPARKWNDRKHKQEGDNRGSKRRPSEPTPTTTPRKKDKTHTVKHKEAPWKARKKG